jgi:hypothetical protein
MPFKFQDSTFHTGTGTTLRFKHFEQPIELPLTEELYGIVRQATGPYINPTKLYMELPERLQSTLDDIKRMAVSTAAKNWRSWSGRNDVVLTYKENIYDGLNRAKIPSIIQVTKDRTRFRNVRRGFYRESQAHGTVETEETPRQDAKVKGRLLVKSFWINREKAQFGPCLEVQHLIDFGIVGEQETNPDQSDAEVMAVLKELHQFGSGKTDDLSSDSENESVSTTDSQLSEYSRTHKRRRVANDI